MYVTIFKSLATWETTFHLQVLIYGVVPKGLLTFLGSLYKEVMKTTSGALVYRFERQNRQEKFLPPKNTVSLT